jgi:hypothetical protein
MILPLQGLIEYSCLPMWYSKAYVRLVRVSERLSEQLRTVASSYV